MATRAAADIAISELELSIRSANLLARLDVHTAADAAALGRADLLWDPTGTPRAVREIERVLARDAGVALAGDDRTRARPPPSSTRFTWGCLYVFGPLAIAESALAAAYGDAGLARARVGDDEGIAEPEMNDSPTLSADDVLVLAESTAVTAVASHRFALTPRDRQALARALAKDGVAVLSIASHEDGVDVSLYREGRGVDDLDAAIGLLTSSPSRAADLRAASSLHADIFANLAGLDCRGYLDAFEAAPLSDYGEDRLWCFR